LEGCPYIDFSVYSCLWDFVMCELLFGNNLRGTVHFALLHRQDIERLK